MDNSTLKSIDLFAGAGGLSEGLRAAGFECLWANEFDSFASNTFRENFTNTRLSSEDITSINPLDIMSDLGLDKGKLDLLVGGPPCQGFSTYGKREQADPRNQLYRNYFNFVETFLPKVFVMENVAGLLSMSEGEVVADILKIANAIGYHCKVHLVRAELYGVPQKRKRVFVIGTRKGVSPDFIEPSNGLGVGHDDLFSRADSPKPIVTVRDAISDLMSCEALPPAKANVATVYSVEPETQYQSMMRAGVGALHGHSCKRMMGIRRLRLALLRPGDYGDRLRSRIQGKGLPYELIDEILTGTSEGRAFEGCRKQDITKELELREMLHEGRHTIDEVMSFLDHGGFKNKYRRLKWDEPSHTLVAHMARDCSDFVHPELDRFVTVREAARLQSFPDSFVFSGSQFQQFKQIGNAVPPLLARAVGETVKSHLQSVMFGDSKLRVAS